MAENLRLVIAFDSCGSSPATLGRLRVLFIKTPPLSLSAPIASDSMAMSEGSNVLNDPQSADVTLIVGREGTIMKAHASVSKTALTIDAFADVNH
jgi:hypothetical protein